MSCSIYVKSYSLIHYEFSSLSKIIGGTKKMAKFDYMEFENNGMGFSDLVFNAKKYTKEQVVEIFNKEYNSNEYFKCDVNDIKSRSAKYYPKGNSVCHSKKTAIGGHYAFAFYGEKGVFPVWVITINDLDRNNKSEQTT